MKYYLFDYVTQGEVYYINRKRCGMNRRSYGKLIGVSEQKLIDRESEMVRAENQPHLELFEECIVYMRRNGIGTLELAEKMGVWKTTMCQWKRGEGDYDRLFNWLRKYDKECNTVSKTLPQKHTDSGSIDW